MKKDLLKIMEFNSSADCRKWFAKKHTQTDGIWIRIFKKTSGQKSVSYAEALDQALCYGWIDGQKQKFDEQSWLQRFTPRRAKSSWSKINTQHAERLIKSGKMASAGLKAVESAKSDGRWKRAYDSPAKSTMPTDFLKALAKNKQAKTFFTTLNKANLYAITYRLQNSKKPETRERWIQRIIEMLAKSEKFHP